MKASSEVWTLLQNYVALGVFKLELPVPTANGKPITSFKLFFNYSNADILNFSC